MTDSMQQTVLTVDAAGRIGAVFSGHIFAQGLDLPENANGSVFAPEENSLIQWLDTAGLVHAEIEASRLSATETELLLAANRLNSRERGILQLLAYSSPPGEGEFASLIVQSTPFQRLIMVRMSTGPELILLDSEEKSHFIRWAEKKKAVTANGTVELEWPGASTETNEPTIAHPLGVVPKQIVTGTTLTGATVGCRSRTAANFKIRASAPGGAPAAGTKVSVDWFAIG